MASQSLISQANGGHRTLGWARMVTQFGVGITIKLFEDFSGYGRFSNGMPENMREGFVFTWENTPKELLQYISKRHFTISRKSRQDQLNWSPAVLQCFGRNGVFVNNLYVPEGSSRILKHGKCQLVLLFFEILLKI